MILIKGRIKKIVISPTFECNFHCIHCGLKKTGKSRSVPILPVKKFLREARRIGIKNLEISGGEPLLNFKKTLKIIKLAKRMKFKIILNTNGYFIAFPNPKRTIKKLRSVDHIVLSVDYDHLKFISYPRILDVIKTILNSDIKLSINMTNRKDTFHENFILLKRLSDDLHGRLFKLPLLNFSNLNLRYYYLSFNFCIIFCGKTIPVGIFNTVKTSINKNRVQTQPMKLEQILYTPCMGSEPLIDYNSIVYPCCSMQALNHPKLYSAGKVSKKQQKIFDIENLMLNNIIHGVFPFLKIF